MNEINLLSQALDLATGAGVYKTIQEVNQIGHCVGVLRAKMERLEKLEAELKLESPSIGEKPGPSRVKHKGN